MTLRSGRLGLTTLSTGWRTRLRYAKKHAWGTRKMNPFDQNPYEPGIAPTLSRHLIEFGDACEVGEQRMRFVELSR
jgi:hypothetical protein